jgi:hypothetical protein
LPRGRHRHITDLRHTASFGSQVARSSGQLILDRSFTHFCLEVALAHGALEADSFVALANTRSSSELTAGLDVCFARRSCTRRRAPPTLAQRTVTARARALGAESFVTPRETHIIHGRASGPGVFRSSLLHSSAAPSDARATDGSRSRTGAVLDAPPLAAMRSRRLRGIL